MTIYKAKTRPRATAPRPTMLAAAPPVLSAGAEPVGELAPEALEAAALVAEATAELAAEAAPEAAAEGARLAGTETEMPADSQMPARMGTSSVGRGSASSWGMGWTREGFNVLAWSSGWHLLDTQVVTDLVMAAWPVVHWHLTSETPQPDSGMAATRQGTWGGGVPSVYGVSLWEALYKTRALTAQLGTWDRSGVWAETTTSEAAAAAMVEKRMLRDWWLGGFGIERVLFV